MMTPSSCKSPCDIMMDNQMEIQLYYSWRGHLWALASITLMTWISWYFGYDWSLWIAVFSTAATAGVVIKLSAMDSPQAIEHKLRCFNKSKFNTPKSEKVPETPGSTLSTISITSFTTPNDNSARKASQTLSETRRRTFNTPTSAYSTPFALKTPQSTNAVSFHKDTEALLSGTKQSSSDTEPFPFGTPNSKSNRTPSKTPNKTDIDCFRSVKIEWMDNDERNEYEDNVDKWEENLKSELVKFINENVIQPWDQNKKDLMNLRPDIFTESELEKDFTDESKTQRVLEALYKKSREAYAQEFSAPNTDKAKIQDHVMKLENLTSQRMKLGRALTLPESLSRDSNGEYSKKAIYERLSSLKLSRLSTSAPYEADIIVHGVCLWLDCKLSAGADSGFASLHIIDSNSSNTLTSETDGEVVVTSDLKTGRHKSWGLYRSKREEKGEKVPHYDVVVHGKITHVNPTRKNALAALVLLMHSLIRSKVRGYEDIERIIFGEKSN